MNVAVLGLGKLGLPIAVTIAYKGIQVYGYDKDESAREPIKRKWNEAGSWLHDFPTMLNQVIHTKKLQIGNSCKFTIERADIIFVVVQTPHKPELDGSKLLPEERVGFGTYHLYECCNELGWCVKPHQTVVIVSTVLPGTTREVVLSQLEGKCKVVYSPLFCAMGTVVEDYLDPEFVLMGVDEPEDADKLREFYEEVLDTDKSIITSIESAELAKVSYNLFISLKITFANSVMEISHKTLNCDCDEVYSVLSKATDRIISPKYLKGGMVDSGACHPRDAIAMSWLESQPHIRASYPIFEQLTLAREQQSKWLVKLLLDNAGELPLVILGKSFKPESHITQGSAALLCADILFRLGHRYIQWDPIVDEGSFSIQDYPAAYLLACNHKYFQTYQFPKGSVVIDPFRSLKSQDGVTLISVGKGPRL